VPRFREKVERLARVQPRLSILPALQAFLATCTELALEFGDERERFRREDLAERRAQFAVNFNA
jgi:hypothetical protein